jgi:asparagine N-glycosylation enzyme membrane subunit Stt3
VNEQPSNGTRRSGNAVTRSLAAFGRFWWEFLIGDTPELFLATLVIVGLAEALHRERVLGIVVVLVAVVGFLGVSTWRGRSISK